MPDNSGTAPHEQLGKDLFVVVAQTCFLGLRFLGDLIRLERPQT